MTAPDAIALLDWILAGSRRNDASVLQTARAMLLLGLDPTTDDPLPDDWGRRTLLQELADSGWRGDPDLARTALPWVGVEVIVGCDTDEVAQWVQVARMWPSVEATLTGRAKYAHRTAPQLVAAAFTAGHAPSWLAGMLATAREHACDPLLVGVGPAATPAILADAATAGLDDAQAVRALTGGDADQLLDLLGLIADGAAEGGIIAARASGLHRAEWADVLPGMPASWFPTPNGMQGALEAEPDRLAVEQGMLGAGWTWDELALLRDRRWTGVGRHTLTEGLVYKLGTRHSSRRLRLGKDELLQMTEWGPQKAVEGMMRAVTDGRSNDEWNAPLAWAHEPGKVKKVTMQLLDVVRATHVAAYRRAGCRTADDVLAAMDAGVTAAMCDQLVAAHSVSKHGRPITRLVPGTLIPLAVRDGLITAPGASASGPFPQPEGDYDA